MEAIYEKTLCFLLMISFCVLVGCSDNGFEANVSDSSDINQTSVTGNICSIMGVPSHRFDSFCELKDWFTPNENSISPAMSDYDQYKDEEWTETGDKYNELIELMENGEYQLKIPYLGDAPMTLSNREGFSNIVLFTKELYGRPWIWYNGTIDNQKDASDADYIISIMYLTNDEKEYASSHSASDFLSYFSPNAPNIDNVPESYDRVYEQTISLKDREVSSIVYEVKDYSRIFKLFAYDDMYIKILAKPDIINTIIDQGLSFGVYS